MSLVRVCCPSDVEGDDGSPREEERSGGEDDSRERGRVKYLNSSDYGSSATTGLIGDRRDSDDVNGERIGEPGTVLMAHCKSKEKNLGDDAISFNQEIGWSFSPDIDLTTIFTHSANWKDKDGFKISESDGQDPVLWGTGAVTCVVAGNSGIRVRDASYMRVAIVQLTASASKPSPVVITDYGHGYDDILSCDMTFGNDRSRPPPWNCYGHYRNTNAYDPPYADAHARNIVHALLQQNTDLSTNGQARNSAADLNCSLVMVQKPEKLDGFRALVRHRQSVTAVALAADDQKGFSVSKDGSIIQWDIHNGKSEKYVWPDKEIMISHGAKNPQNPLKTWSKHVLALDVSFDGRYLATGGLDRHVHLWDTRTRQHIQAFSGHRGPVSSLTFRQGSLELIFASFDRTIKLWNAEDRAYMDSLFGHRAEVLSIDCLRKEWLLTIGHDRTMRLWKTNLSLKWTIGFSLSCARIRHPTLNFLLSDSKKLSEKLVFAWEPLIGGIYYVLI
ncbi:hypothetical protein Sjap_002675 [Stephania japonica]|uniref:Uncharacterized protein n=1 Tax=Stephania japonica TaxID=461633 RepID=A0AAP0KN78_9MAGN